MCVCARASTRRAGRLARDPSRLLPPSLHPTLTRCLLHRLLPQLHDSLTSKVAKLPATFPVPKTYMPPTESVKRERVERLRDYLRLVVKLSDDRPLPTALLKFLRVEPGVLASAGGSGGGASATGSGGEASGLYDPDKPISPFSPFSRNFVPERPDDVNEGLREAIKAGDTPLCLELIKSNADVNYRDRQGNTPLHMACLFQRSDVAKALLLAGADLTLKNGAGELPERMASVSLKMKFNTFKQTGQI